MRVLNQRVHIDIAKRNIKELEVNDTAYVVTDFKMKYTPTRYRETSQQHFGKRGMSWNGFMVLYHPSAECNLRYTVDNDSNEFEHFYIDAISVGDATQDYYMVLSGFEMLISEITKHLPHVKKIIIQSDNARCYQSGALLYGIAQINRHSTVQIIRFIHTETQDGKCSIDAHFAIAMAHILRYVAMGNNCVTPSQVVAALHANGGVQNTTAHLYLVDRDAMNEIESLHASEIQIFKKYPRCNDVEFTSSEVRMHDYSGFPAMYVIRLNGSTGNDEVVVSSDAEDSTQSDESDIPEGYYDDEPNVLSASNMLVDTPNTYVDVASEIECTETNTSNEDKLVCIGTITKVQVVPRGVIERRRRRWKNSNRNNETISEFMTQPIPDNICSICCRVFRNER